jgi:hypothetical protein
MKICLHIIAWKIDVRPFLDSPGNDKINEMTRQMGYALAFAKMHTDCAQAALHGNLGEILPPAVTGATMPTGFLCQAYVLNLEDGLSTIRELVKRYDLDGVCEIAWQTHPDPKWHHFTGPDLGPFENHLEEAEKWGKSLKETAERLSAPLNPSSP